LQIVALVLTPTGDAMVPVSADNVAMTMELLGRVRGRIHSGDAERLAGCCTHAHVPDHPAADGYRYHDLGGELPPFYVRRFEFDGRTAAVTLTAPVEASSGDDAERGAPAIARVGVSYGMRAIPFQDVLTAELLPGESALLARIVVEALLDLRLLEPADCPFCA
jgi:hypothetical protein